MDISYVVLIIQSVLVVVTVVNVFLVYITIKSNESTNKNNLFDRVVAQERNLRIQLNKYRDIIHDDIFSERKINNARGDYDTLLFNYYEYFALCILKEFINEDYAKIFFRSHLSSVWDLFDGSILFK